MNLPLLQAAPAAQYYYYYASQMPFGNLLLIVLFAAFALGMAGWLVAKHATKIGPLELKRARSCETYVYEMNRENAGHDDRLRERIRLAIYSFDTDFENIFYGFNACPAARVALANMPGGVLHDSARDNHFAALLAAERRGEYLEGLLKQMGAKYRSVHGALEGGRCGEGGGIPAWEDEAEPQMAAFLAALARKMSEAVDAACRAKIEVYERYLAKFKAAGDAFHARMAEGLIAKNKNYIAGLERRGGKGW